MRSGLARWIALVLLVSCSNKGSDKVTRQQCSEVADHIANLIIAHYEAHPEELWDQMAATSERGLPEGVTKETFKSYLATPEGKTWMMQAQGAARTGTEQGIEPCVQQATPTLVKCLLAAKTKDDVTACDKAK